MGITTKPSRNLTTKGGIAIKNVGHAQKPVIIGTNSEALRNAEHYLYAYSTIQSNVYQWGPMLTFTVGYNAAKFWANVADYYGLMHSPYGYSVPTTDELMAGIEGSNDGLFGNSGNSSCGCHGQ